MATLEEFIKIEHGRSRLKIAKKLQAYARRYHRYKHRTHKLKGSTVPVLPSNSLFVGVTATIDYAKYVINGHGTWAPDPFLEVAMARNRQFARDQLKTCVARAVRAYNRQNKR